VYIIIYLSLNDKQDKCQALIFSFYNKMQQEEIFPVMVSLFVLSKLWNRFI